MSARPAPDSAPDSAPGPASEPVAAWLPDGRRLHLQHGPIDLILDASGPGRRAALDRAALRFRSVLAELVAELPALRAQAPGPLCGPVARRMGRAIAPFAEFVTPMAAVAGAVADEIAAEMAGPGVTRAYVNNGGDVAWILTRGERFDAAIHGTPARVTLCASGGMATSGWGGRSHSLGIADSVTVLAKNAAIADAAATLIANAVDLPGHAGIVRVPACQIDPDSDLGARPVTTAVPVLTPAESRAALAAGLARAEEYRRRGLIRAAWLTCQGQHTTTATSATRDIAHA